MGIEGHLRREGLDIVEIGTDVNRTRSKPIFIRLFLSNSQRCEMFSF